MYYASRNHPFFDLAHGILFHARKSVQFTSQANQYIIWRFVCYILIDWSAKSKEIEKSIQWRCGIIIFRCSGVSFDLVSNWIMFAFLHILWLIWFGFEVFWFDRVLFARTIPILISMVPKEAFFLCMYTNCDVCAVGWCGGWYRCPGWFVHSLVGYLNRSLVKLLARWDRWDFLSCTACTITGYPFTTSASYIYYCWEITDFKCKLLNHINHIRLRKYQNE